MARTPKKLVQVTIDAGDNDIYICPADTRTQVVAILAVNNDTAVRNVKFHGHGSSGSVDGNIILPYQELAADATGGIREDDLKIVLSAGDHLYAYADSGTADKITVSVYGIEEDIA